jgi:acetyl-CoA C-acetyltransferase
VGDDLTPILIGVGQYIEKPVEISEAGGPVDFMIEAIWKAADDAGIGREKLSDIDLLVVVKDMANILHNPPESIAKILGADKAKKYFTWQGGNTPQFGVNFAAEQISKGNINFALLTGAEAVDTLLKSAAAGIELDWGKKSETDPEMLTKATSGVSPIEQKHGLFMPVTTYPLFENALRGHYGRTIEEHKQVMGKLLSRLSDVATENPYSWFPVKRTPEEITTPSSSNRYISFPYTKLMSAMIMVNQSAAVLMTSVGSAKRMGIDESKWIYLNGCADANDHWYMIDRANYYSSPAITIAGNKALEMADTSIDEIDFLDIYSCFPSAVEVCCDMLGISYDDPRQHTVTGGLQSFGGPGNNYTMHAIATMVEKLRKNPGKKGFVTGNGFNLTKHSFGVYSTEPNKKAWYRESPESYQAEIDSLPSTETVEEPSGNGTLETYNVIFKKDGTPEIGIVIGRDDQGRRFIANTPDDISILENMVESDVLGQSGKISQVDGKNVFSPH